MSDVRSLGVRLTHVYYNEEWVGFRCTNAVDDVLLVQYFLQKIYEKNSPVPLGARSLRLDGLFGPKTHYWLLFFREQVRASGSVLKDTNLAGGSRGLGVANPWSNTMMALNAAYEDLYPGGLAKFTEQPDMPMLLKNKLLAPR